MYRSIARALTAAAIVAAVPAIGQAQAVLSCYKLGANVTNANCSVISELTLVSVAALNITEPANPDFDISALTAAQWIDIINGVATRVQPSGPFAVDIAANAAGLNVNISGAVVAAGTGVRASTDYEYEFIPAANSCSGSGAPIPAAATAATGLPATAGFAQRRLCLYAVLDGTVAASIEPDTYELTVTLAITAP